MSKSTLTDLNEHLFAQLERLNDEDVKGDELAEEIERSKAISQISNQIVSAGKLMLDASTMVNRPNMKVEKILGVEHNGN